MMITTHDRRFSLICALIVTLMLVSAWTATTFAQNVVVTQTNPVVLGGTCTNQVVTVIAGGSAIPTCASVTAALFGTLTSAELRTIVSDENGAGVLLFNALAADLTFGGNLAITRTTADAADTGVLAVTGAGALADNGSRGAYVKATGNENSDPGRIVLSAGNVAAAKVSILGNGGTEWFAIDGATGTGTAATSSDVLSTINSTNANGGAFLLQRSGVTKAYFGNAEAINTAVGTNEDSLFWATGVLYLAGSGSSSYVMALDSSGFYPINNTFSLGKTGRLFTEVFAVNGMINTSDEREKSIVGDVPGLDFINAITPFAFQWNDGDDRAVHYGIGARQVGALVSDDAGLVRRSPSEAWGLNYAELTPSLIRAIQELTARLAVVESR